MSEVYEMMSEFAIRLAEITTNTALAFFCETPYTLVSS